MASGPFYVNRELVSKEASTSLAVSWGLHKERPWSRPLLLTLFVAMSVFSLAAGWVAGMATRPALIAAATGAFLCASLWRYLYRDDNVVDYYIDVLERG